MPPKIIIKDDDQPKPPVPSFEDKIRAAAEQWKSRNSNRIQVEISDMLDASLRKLILDTLGFTESWGKLEFSPYKSTDASITIKQLAKDTAANLFEKIDFSTVELSPAEIKSIKSAYKTALKDAALSAAQDLAVRDALNVAEQVIGIKLDPYDFVEIE